MCFTSSFTFFESLTKYQLFSEMFPILCWSLPFPPLFFCITYSSQALEVYFYLSHRDIAAHLHKWSKWELTSSMWSSPQESRYMLHWNCCCPKYFGDNFLKNCIPRQPKALQGKQSCVLKAVFLSVVQRSLTSQSPGWVGSLLKQAISWVFPQIYWTRISEGWGWGTCLLE